MPRYVVYQYDPKTGFINGTNAAERQNDDPFLTLPGHLAVTDFITATMITAHPDRPQESVAVQVHGGGWSFVLGEDGRPSTDADGNYMLAPPAWSTIPPSTHDYAVLGHIRAGVLDPAKDFHPNYITGLNRALAAVGARTISDVAVQPVPTRTCISNNASLKPAG